MDLNHSISNFERLNKNLGLMRARAGFVNRQLSQLACYPEVCIEQAQINYKVSVTSSELMNEVIRCANLMPEDPTSELLINYMTKHIKEEKGHDEWCLEDLEVFGIEREKVKQRIPSSNLASLIGSQYYWIRHCHPVAFMGYLACLEVNHPTVEYVETLIARSGLPSKGFNSLLHHAKIDMHHKQDIIDTINALVLTEQQFQLMELSAFQTYRYLALVMEDICKVAPIQDKATA